MHIPESTYRIQFNQDFTFLDLEKIIDYLDELGISMIYASPIFKATPGSTHGYDVTNPNEINPEIGTRDDLVRISKKLKEKNIHWLQDIVPNHMAFNTHNERLMDVLERGDQSPYYAYFDITWDHPSPDLKSKLMVPFLGKTLAEAVKDRDLQLTLREDGLAIAYFDTTFPVSLRAIEWLATRYWKDLQALSAMSEGLDLNAWTIRKKAWWSAQHNDPSSLAALRQMVADINSDAVRFHELLESQCYVFCHWKRTEKEINFRRFFTINDLICLRMEDRKVFDDYHALLLSLYRDNVIHGLRIDHIDGLHDPTQYVSDLREVFGEACYIIAEKILEAREDMPEYWPLQGASGYQFLSHVNQVLTNREGAQKLLTFYREIVPEVPKYRELVFSNKKLMLERYMAGERQNLVELFFRLELSTPSFERTSVETALSLIMLSMPVYRIYPRQIPLTGNNRKVMQEAFMVARQQDEVTDELEYLEGLFLEPVTSESREGKILFFLRRMMQFTGPLTAKGIEDTTYYMYNPLISHDEVGDTPAVLGISIAAFHQRMQVRKTRVPLSLNATATHDTKRGEDARMRLNTLTEHAESWMEKVAHWFTINQTHHQEGHRRVPDRNDEYFIYQSLVGGLPDDFRITAEWKERFNSYLIKAMREAKVHSNWEAPEADYENGTLRFVDRLLDPEGPFIEEFIEFMRVLIPRARAFSLAQSLLKITAPGIPDIFQGCELWDLSFVDPDNRRPVDYELRQSMLKEIVTREKKSQDALLSYLTEMDSAGAAKLYLTWKALNLGRSYPDVFIQGDYLPLTNDAEAGVLAFARSFGNDWILTAVQLDAKAGNGVLTLSSEMPRQWYNHLGGQVITADGKLNHGELFRSFPVALLSNMA